LSAGDTIVRFVDIGKTYDGVARIIDKLDLDIRRGEFLTLLGPSGSGKTTTLMLLADSRRRHRGRSCSTASRSRACRRIDGTSAWCSRTTPCSRT